MENFIAQDVPLTINGEEMFFRPMTLEDKVWLRGIYGDRIQSLFSEKNIDLEALSRIAFRLLRNNHTYSPQKITIVDEDGNQKETTIGGWKLFAKKFIGNDALISLTIAVMNAIEKGDPEKKDIDTSEGASAGE